MECGDDPDCRPPYGNGPATGRSKSIKRFEFPAFLSGGSCGQQSRSEAKARNDGSGPRVWTTQELSGPFGRRDYKFLGAQAVVGKLLNPDRSQNLLWP